MKRLIFDDSFDMIDRCKSDSIIYLYVKFIKKDTVPFFINKNCVNLESDWQNKMQITDNEISNLKGMLYEGDCYIIKIKKGMYYFTITEIIFNVTKQINYLTTK